MIYAYDINVVANRGITLLEKKPGVNIDFILQQG
jgi:hypothetical protein